jgi:type III secretory pathway component EscS
LTTTTKVIGARFGDALLYCLSGLVLLVSVSLVAVAPFAGLIMATGGLAGLPVVWRKLLPNFRARRPLLWVAPVAGIIIGFVLVPNQIQEGWAAEQREKDRHEALVQKETDDREQAAAKADEAQQIASGDHCLSGWDGSLPVLKEAVKQALRKPSSFEHIETVRTPVDDHGKFGVIMTYRAENGFGGMNVEAIGVEVEARTCNFRRASPESLAKRLGN